MEKFITKSIEVKDLSGSSRHVTMSSIAGVREHVVEVHDFSSITHKRVVVHFRDHTMDEDFSIHLSPIGAMALVRRLIDVLDECQREGIEVPSLHSDLAYKLASHVIDGVSIPVEDIDALKAYANSAYRVEVG